MPARMLDLTGCRYGPLTVLGYAGRSDDARRRLLWLCRCGICGAESVRLAHNLKRSACNCMRGFRHGMEGTRVYKSWEGMKHRCQNPNNRQYKDYGGRGIKVCDRWRDFKNFYADMGERPAGKSLDRINNDGHYEPGNCRWATPKEQQNNTRRNRAANS